MLSQRPVRSGSLFERSPRNPLNGGHLNTGLRVCLPGLSRGWNCAMSSRQPQAGYFCLSSVSARPRRGPLRYPAAVRGLGPSLTDFMCAAARTTRSARFGRAPSLEC